MNNLIVDEENEDEIYWTLHRFYKRKFLNYFQTEKNLDPRFVKKVLRSLEKYKLNSIKNHYNNIFRNKQNESKTN